MTSADIVSEIRSSQSVEAGPCSEAVPRPGVTRRHILRAGIAEFLYCCAALPALAARAVEANGSGLSALNWSSFIDKLEFAATSQHRPQWDQDHYVQKVAALAKALNLRDSRLVSLMGGRRHFPQNYPEFRNLLHTADIEVTLISFEKGEEIPHHDHPSMTGVIACVAGSVEVKRYDTLGVPAPAGVLLKSLGRQQLEPGRVSTLTAESGNVHALKAGAFSQIVDIFTPPYDERRINTTHWFRLDPLPAGRTGDVFVAHRLGSGDGAGAPLR